jgi:putative glutathione S-transferase
MMASKINQTAPAAKSKLNQFEGRKSLKSTGGSWLTSTTNEGEFKRKQSVFRDWIKEGSDHPPTSGRYHLIVAMACPWANRTLIMRNLKGLADSISVDVVSPYLGDMGWSFLNPQGDAAVTGDSLNGFEFLQQYYTTANPEYEGHWTVPVLWDKEANTIVNNESSEIIRMLNSGFNQYSGAPELDLYPEHLRSAIDEVNAWVYTDVNNGVYRTGFAKTQSAYESACKTLFAGLDRLESMLDGSRYLTGDYVTEADLRLWTTLVRFDPVYAVHFKCNQQLISQYKNLWNYTKELYQVPAFGDTFNLDQVKKHYYMSHKNLNPQGIVPLGPRNYLESLAEPHDRARFGTQPETRFFYHSNPAA